MGVTADDHRFRAWKVSLPRSGVRQRDWPLLYGARFYDPGLGRWLSEDPVQDKPFEPASLNFYTYVLNNPLIYTDLAGMEQVAEGQTAAERLQAFVDLILALERLIKSMQDASQTSLSVGGKTLSLSDLRGLLGSLNGRGLGASGSGDWVSLLSLLSGSATLRCGNPLGCSRR